MERIAILGARVLTLGDPTPRRGEACRELGAIPDADLLIVDGKIERIGKGAANGVAVDRTIRAGGRAVMPAFIDAHTHACWAGERLDEWEMKQRGATYLEILQAGGGIMSTVRAVRATSKADLQRDLTERLNAMLAHGTVACEVKSGYGLSTADELKMLEAISDAGTEWVGEVVPTACIAHAKGPDVDPLAFVRTTIDETLPAVSRSHSGIAIDAYTEEGAWSTEETIELFEAAQCAGHPVRVHADQFNSLGMVQWMLEHDGLSVDHLEASPTELVEAVGRSDCFAVMLPCSGFHVDGRYADGRALIDAGGMPVIATNVNPGSAPCLSMPMAIALAVRHLGITAAEAITACTVNAACLLRAQSPGFRATGVLQEGGRADLIMLRHRDERQLGYEFGGNPVQLVVLEGRTVVG